MIHYRLDVPALAATRFARSALLEARNALRVLHPQRRQDHPVFAEWRAEAQHRIRRAGLDLRPLYDLIPPSNYAPDFLAPVPPGDDATVADELAVVRRTPARRVAAELARIPGRLSPGTGVHRRAAARALAAADPASVRDQAADLLAAFWELALADRWPTMRTLLDREIARRADQLARHGVGPTLDALHRGIRWQAGELLVRRPFPAEVAVDGRGLVLLPSVFAGVRLGGTTDPPLQPTVWYGAPSLAHLRQPGHRPPARVEALLGRSRTAVLAALDQPTTTTELAAQLGLSPGAVSGHLTVLRNAHLTASQRHGHQVRYQRTALADHLLGDPTTSR